MKRGEIGKLFLMLIALIFVSSAVFAVDAGTCNIVPRASCTGTGNYILMGLSSSTNAHAQSFPNTDYPYVLCCGFGTGNTTCRTSPTSNKVIGLSSLTNAHAESPEQITYSTVKVCYEDLSCIGTNSTSCPTDHPLGILSLSSSTNAHIGNFSDYPVKICCGGTSIARLSCRIKSASWNTQSAIENQTVYMNVIGSGAECDGVSLAFQILGPNPTKQNGTAVTFMGSTAMSSWKAEWQQASFLGGDASYRFNVSTPNADIMSSVVSSSPDLTVRKADIVDFCSSVSTCSDYTDEGTCDSDASLCNVAKDSSLSGVDCSAADISCSCAWDSSSSTCGFSYVQIQPSACTNGYTLCTDNDGVEYCAPSCESTGGTPTSNNNSVCDNTDSCASSDCHDGDQASCAAGTQCLSGVCYSATASALNVTCDYGYTLCRISGTNYCYPGNSCPSGQNPVSNNNSICEMGEGCLSPDCQDGSQDSCISGTYCSLGECSSVQSPVLSGVSGGCKITQTVEKTCDQEPAGYKILRWTGVWTGNQTGAAYLACIAGGRTTVPCPAQIQLPFFSYAELAITVVVIALIYFFIISKKKFKKKK